MSWEKVKMGNFLINRESRFKPKDKAIAGLKRIDKIDFSGNIYLSDKASNTDMILVKKGDLVISGINVEKGAMSVYQGEEDVIATIHYSSYSFDDKKIDIEFLKMFLKSSEFKSALKEQVPGGIKTEIKPKHLLPLQVVIPVKVSEQREVVKEFLKLQVLSTNLGTEIYNQNDMVFQLRQSFLREAMQGQLVKQDPKDGHAKDLLEKIKAEKAKSGRKEKELPPIKPEEIPFEIPENWLWCRLGDLTSLITSGSRNWNQYYSNEGALFIRSQNIKETEIDLSVRSFVKLPVSTEGLRTSVKASDILITITGAGVSNAGLLESIDFSEGYVSQHVCLVRMIDPEVSKWAHYCIIAGSVGKEQFKELIYGDKPGLNLTQINNLKIPVPPLSEQLRIIRKLSELLNLCDELHESIQASRVQNELLLQQVLKEALME